MIEGPPLSAEQEAEIAAALRTALDRFQVPRRFAYLPHLPMTATGKILKRELVAAPEMQPVMAD